jgi:hypothetical protein
MIKKETLDSFIASLSILDDDVYFDMVSSYLGKIPTPFDKQQLHQKLASIFHKESFVSTLISRLDTLDVLFINATYFVSHIGEEELIHLFEDEFPYSFLKQKIVNLEERLILLPSPTYLNQVCLNQMLIEPFKKKVIHQHLLFPSNTSTPYTFTHFFSHYLQALYSVVIHNPKEKLMKEIVYITQPKGDKNAFGAPSDVEKMMREVLLSFCIKHRKQHDFMTTFMQLDSLSLASVCIDMYNEKFSHPFSINTQREQIASLIHLISNGVEVLAICDSKSLKRLIKISAALINIELYDVDEFMELLQICGLSTTTYSNNQKKGVIDSDFTLTFHPSSHLYEYHPIHYYAQIKNFDIVISYFISKETIFHAFDNNLSVEEIIEDLTSWAKNSNQLLIDNIHHYKSEYDQIRLYDGITICVDERIERIIEGYPLLHQYVIKKLGDGIFLFDREKEEHWRKEFSQVGIQNLPRTIKGDISNDSGLIDTLQIIDEKRDHKLFDIKSDTTVPIISQIDDKKIVESLKAAVLKKFSDKAIQEELFRKIDEKIVMVPSQIQFAIHSPLIMKASGFDYNKKVRVIKTALENPSLYVEIKMINDEEAFISILCEVINYTNGPNEGMVVVKQIPQMSEITIPVERIFMIRTIRKSVFF